MKISIITVTLNNKAGLLRAIESVRSQTYKNVEHIIVDGGSTDGTAEAINNYQLTINNEQLIINNLKFLSEKDNGIYDAINKGIKLVTGEVIGLLHSDDFYSDNDVLNDVAKEFIKKNADLVYGDLKYVSKYDNKKIIRNWKSGYYNRRKLNFGWMPPHPTVFIKKALIQRNNFYDTNFKISSDYDWILGILSENNLKISYLPKNFITMQTGGASNKTIMNILKKSSEDYKALKKNGYPYPFITLLLKNIRKINQLFT